MGTNFNFQEKSDGESLLFVFEGSIDEDVTFPTSAPGKYKNIFIDLKGVKTINSVGIREWLNWLKPIAEVSQVILMKCPKALVFQLNMVEGFLPKNGLVKSFYVPYFCEKCDKEENVLFTVGTEIVLSAAGPKINFNVKDAKLCSEAACEMEMDASEAKYFQFLKRMSQP